MNNKVDGWHVTRGCTDVCLASSSFICSLWHWGIEECVVSLILSPSFLWPECYWWTSYLFINFFSLHFSLLHRGVQRGLVCFTFFFSISLPCTLLVDLWLRFLNCFWSCGSSLPSLLQHKSNTRRHSLFCLLFHSSALNVIGGLV